MRGVRNHEYFFNGRGRTVCTSACLAHLGIPPEKYNYSSKWGDMERIMRNNGYAVRSRRSKVPSGTTVGGARKYLAKLNDPPGTVYYVSVPGHAMLLDGDGETIVDTAPRRRDRRTLLRVYAVFPR